MQAQPPFCSSLGKKQNTNIHTHLEDRGDMLLIEGAVGEGSHGHLLGQAVDVVGSLDVVHVLDDVLVRVGKSHPGEQKYRVRRASVACSSWVCGGVPSPSFFSPSFHVHSGIG